MHMQTAEHYTASHERSKHNIKLPVFDINTYNKILSRMGRQSKILSRKEIGSHKFSEIKSSYNRSEKLKKSLLSLFFTDLAIYVAFHKHDGSLNAMIADGFLPEEIRKIMVEHWSLFQIKLRKARALYE